MRTAAAAAAARNQITQAFLRVESRRNASSSKWDKWAREGERESQREPDSEYQTWFFTLSTLLFQFLTFWFISKQLLKRAESSHANTCDDLRSIMDELMTGWIKSDMCVFFLFLRPKVTDGHGFGRLSRSTVMWQVDCALESGAWNQAALASLQRPPSIIRLFTSSASESPRSLPGPDSQVARIATETERERD